MTTDEQILALVATGKFTLPEGLVYEVADGLSWFLQNHNGRKIWHLESGQHKHAHDLCAMHFAREQRSRWGRLAGTSEHGVYKNDQAAGDSALAIKALHAAVCGKEAK